MSRQIKLIVTAVVIFLLSFTFFISKPESVLAQVCGGCVSWCFKTSPCQDAYGDWGTCTAYACCDNGDPAPPPYCGSTCGPGTYPSNGGCHPIATSSPGPTGGGGGTPTATPVPTCSVTLSPSTSTNVVVGSNFTLTETVSTNQTLEQVTTTSSNGNATAGATTGAYPTFTSTITGVTVGTSTITANVVTSGGNCSANITVNTVNPQHGGR